MNGNWRPADRFLLCQVATRPFFAGTKLGNYNGIRFGL